MTDVIGQHLLINKHIPQGKNGKRRRMFFVEGDIDKQRELASKYAEEKGEDYLIVQVIEEVSASPEAKKKGRKIVSKHEKD